VVLVAAGKARKSVGGAVLGASDEKLERLGYEYEVLQQQASELQRQLQLASQLNAENDAAIKALSALKEMSDSLMPIGSGVFAKIRVASSEKVLVEVGARVLSEKSIPEATKFLEQKKSELEKVLNELQQNLAAVAERATEIQSAAAELEAARQR
jgi:prefoldin alpha subunit